ncbi:MAG TPA: MarR family transcriptional regulator [Bryobacteraceae bacterium]|nr:MarR family transcriptional regulator [Bryobacteraceae bacterium]
MPSEVKPLIALPCACANLRRASRVVTQVYDEELRAAGLKTTQFTLLQALHLITPVTQGRLAELLGIDSTTLTRTLRPLIQKGWITSVPGSDKREHSLQLTSPGRRKLKQAEPLWQQAQERLRKGLGDRDWENLRTITVRAAQAASAM